MATSKCTTFRRLRSRRSHHPPPGRSSWVVGRGGCSARTLKPHELRPTTYDQSVDRLARVREAQLLFGPAFLKNALECGPDDALVAVRKGGIKLEDRLARAIAEASRFAVRHGPVAADEIEG